MKKITNYLVEGLGICGEEICTNRPLSAAEAVLIAHSYGGYGASFYRLDRSGFFTPDAPMRFYTSFLEAENFIPSPSDCFYPAESYCKSDQEAINEVASKIIQLGGPMHRYYAIFIHTLELGIAGRVLSVDGIPVDFPDSGYIQNETPIFNSKGLE